MHLLPPTAFDLARPLFLALAQFQVSAGAVLDGECDGRLLVDDPEQPRAALLTSPEGAYLAGDAGSSGFVADLRRHVWDELFGAAEWPLFYATADDPAWERRLTEIAAPREVLRVARRHLECRALRLDWRAMVPEGCDVRMVDEAFLDDEDLVVPGHLRGWIAGNWGSRERYLDRGFGTATACGRTVASWSIADGRSGTTCEIGIQTLPQFRRRGLATVTAAAAVEHALAAGFDAVGWHANADNRASIATAERVGFDLERGYTSLYFYPEEADELAEKAWIAFRDGGAADTVELCRRVFALRPESPDYQYFLAARASAAVGDRAAALAHLSTAVDRGWSDAWATEAAPELEALHDAPEWSAAVARMRRLG